jgi:hypothetical protein
MHLKRFTIISILFLFNVTPDFAQSSIRDSSINLSVIGVHYGRNISAGDMKERFGGSNAIGTSFAYKFSNNIYFKLSYDFIFGENVKEDDILDNILTEKGNLINGLGYLEPVFLDMRGDMLTLKIGKIFPWFGPNPNSGVFLSAGAGFLQHKIHFSYTSGPLYQLRKEYQKGYDRLTNGLTLNQDIGYVFFDNSNFKNFFLGVSFTEGFTQNRRDWNFDEMRKDDTPRTDVIISFRFGINIPVYKKAAQDYYY